MRIKSVIKEFESEQAMLDYEARREKFYLQELEEIDRNRLNFYKQILEYLLIKEYRDQKKDYDNYIGGWWRDLEGHPCAHHIAHLSGMTFREGELAIERQGIAVFGVYIYNKGNWAKLLFDSNFIQDLKRGVYHDILNRL